MGNIQFKRGSVRQAPPQVRVPMMHGPEDDGAYKATGLIIVVVTLVVLAYGLLFILLDALGIYKIDWGSNGEIF